MFLLLAGIIYFINFNTALAADLNKNEEISYLRLDEDLGLGIDGQKIYYMYLGLRAYNKPIVIKNSSVVNLTAGRTKTIKGAKFINSDFYFAKFPGVEFEDCLLKNVNFMSSDLQFVKFKNCKLINVNFKDTVKYGIKNINF